MEQKEIESFLQDAGFFKLKQEMWYKRNYLSICQSVKIPADTWCKSCNFTITQTIKITPDGIRLEIYGRDNENVLVITGGFEILKNTQC